MIRGLNPVSFVLNSFLLQFIPTQVSKPTLTKEEFLKRNSTYVDVYGKTNLMEDFIISNIIATAPSALHLFVVLSDTNKVKNCILLASTPITSDELRGYNPSVTFNGKVGNNSVTLPSKVVILHLNGRFLVVATTEFKKIRTPVKGK